MSLVVSWQSPNLFVGFGWSFSDICLLGAAKYAHLLENVFHTTLTLQALALTTNTVSIKYLCISATKLPSFCYFLGFCYWRRQLCCRNTYLVLTLFVLSASAYSVSISEGWRTFSRRFTKEAQSKFQPVENGSILLIL